MSISKEGIQKSIKTKNGVKLLQLLLIKSSFFIIRLRKFQFNKFSMNDDLIYHQIETGGCRPVIAEFLIYDFRFWYDVEAGSLIF